MVGTYHKLKLVTEWYPKVRYTLNKENLSWFINEFMPMIYFLLYDGPLPWVIPEMVHELQPLSQLLIGDWFLFKDHTIIRVYGFGGRLYRLLSFLTP